MLDLLRAVIDFLPNLGTFTPGPMGFLDPYL